MGGWGMIDYPLSRRRCRRRIQQLGRRRRGSLREPRFAQRTLLNMINEFAHTGDLEVGPGVFISSSAMRFQFARSGGPGGQNVNKLNTKAEVWVRPESLLGMHPEAVGRLRALAGK